MLYITNNISAYNQKLSEYSLRKFQYGKNDKTDPTH